jgi:hypothetical protein
MKRNPRKARRAGGRTSHARVVSRHSTLPAVERLVEIPLPPALNTERVRRKGAVALVDVEGQRLQLRFLRPSLTDDEASTLTAPEEAALLRGGVGPVSADETRLVEAQAAAAYQQLRAESLGVEDAGRRLGVNASRIRQRLAAGSLYGVKDGNAWLLPAFQFVANGLVPSIDVVLKRLPEGLSPLAVARWLDLPNPDLPTRDAEERPQSPRQWLLEGNPPGPAAELAAAL